MVATRELGIRLSVKDADVVRRALQGLGTEGQQSLRRIERASKPASGGLKAVNMAAREGQAALHGYAAQAGPLGSVLSSIGPAGLAVGAGLGIAGGAAALLVGDFAELAERAKVMRESFERMAESRGSNPAQLMREISEATRGTLDQIKSLTVANTALSSGIEPLYKNLGQIIRDTRSVSTALGRNASEDIERVISAINKQEQELLDELGIVARAETAYRTYAAQLGTTASKLDDLQKRTAFANVVIGQLREKAEAVGDPINRTAEASERFGSAWVDLKITLGSMVQTGGVLDKLASGIEAVNAAIANTQFRGAPGPRTLPPLPAGTPDPAEVGLFPTFAKPGSLSVDALSVPKRLVELAEQDVSQNAAILDALNINSQGVRFGKSSDGGNALRCRPPHPRTRSTKGPDCPNDIQTRLKSPCNTSTTHSTRQPATKTSNPLTSASNSSAWCGFMNYSGLRGCAEISWHLDRSDETVEWCSSIAARSRRVGSRSGGRAPG